MSYADAAEFPQRYAGQFQTWEISALGTAYITFNLETGPFAYSSPDGKILREAAAYAADLEAIHQAVYYGHGDIATGYFPRVSP
jgi:ABC-type oligopeptide transport system substrate-binding subunit